MNLAESLKQLNHKSVECKKHFSDEDKAKEGMFEKCVYCGALF